MTTLGKLIVFLSAAAVTAQLAVAASKEEERLEEAAKVLREILDIPEGIPSSLLDKAECVAVVPSVKKFALGFGGKYGRGAMACRTGADFAGRWGAPAMYRLEGGSFGLQLGGSATDFVLLVMNPKGVDSLLKSKAKLGADASAVAGPKGRTAAAETDLYLTAEILTYSRSKGLFAGVSLQGSTLRQDEDSNKKLYRRKISAREILVEDKVDVPAAAQDLVALLRKASPRNKSN